MICLPCSLERSLILNGDANGHRCCGAMRTLCMQVEIKSQANDNKAQCEGLEARLSEARADAAAAASDRSQAAEALALAQVCCMDSMLSSGVPRALCPSAIIQLSRPTHYLAATRGWRCSVCRRESCGCQ